MAAALPGGATAYPGNRAASPESSLGHSKLGLSYAGQPTPRSLRPSSGSEAKMVPQKDWFQCIVYPPPPPRSESLEIPGTIINGIGLGPTNYLTYELTKRKLFWIVVQWPWDGVRSLSTDFEKAMPQQMQIDRSR